MQSELRTLSHPHLRSQLRQGMQQCRQATLALFQGVDYEMMCAQAHPDFSPIGWHLGHIAYTESLWLLEKCVGLSPQFPQYRRLFAADGLPKSERVYLPTLGEIQEYLKTIRSQVLDYLEEAPLDQQERLWRWLLQHESQHAETIALVLELQKGQAAGEPMENRRFKIHLPRAFSTAHRPPSPAPMVCVPAGYFNCGNDAIDALDNERPVQGVDLEAYWIDREPVTCEQYRVFIESGGYQDPCWWTSDGWAWLQAAQVSRPRYWKDGSEWGRHPVCGVSWYEADAYARFVGKRLPTEAEWEKAASWNPVTQQRQIYPWGAAVPTPDHCNYGYQTGSTTPVDAYPPGNSAYGCYDMLGNVWEWTDSWFDGYHGFTAYPYRGYSQAYFDNNHRVLKGGSWATFPWALRSAFRNWYHPHVREILVGFRCAVGCG
ncbi:MAG: ergothioneine biosynthesis protein EgtB [Kovacikia sp.]